MSCDTNVRRWSRRSAEMTGSAVDWTDALARCVFGAVLGAMLLLVAAPASAQFKLERRLALDPGGAFTLASDSGSVIVTGDSTSGAVVTITSASTDFEKRYELTFEETPGAAKLTIKRRGGWTNNLFGGFRGESAKIAVHVPRKASVIVGTSGGGVQVSTLTGDAKVSSSGGGLEVRDVEGRVDADTSGGSIEVRRVRGPVTADTSGGGITIADVGGDVRADTSGGGIEIEGVNGNVRARTSGGGVRVRGAGGQVDAESSGGPVTVAFAPGNGRGGSLSTSGGGVRAEVDPAVALSIDASTSGGAVTSDVPITVRGRIANDALSGDLNGGGPVLKMRSSGGGIRITAVKPQEKPSSAK